MMAEQPTVFGAKATEQIAKTVREVSRRMMLPRGERGRWQFHGGGGGTVATAWASIAASGLDDMFQSVTLYRSASPATFTEVICGTVPFDDMEFTLCDSIGTETVLVPAGYKAGEAGLIKMEDCGGAHAWSGWVVVFGPRMRCAAKIPLTAECCPTTQAIKFTSFQNIWYFGGINGADSSDPCP